MQVDYDGDLKEILERWPEDYRPSFERASAILADTMGQSAAAARAIWSLIKDPRGRNLFRLTVSDWTGSVGYNFAPDELESESQMRYRLHRLWGDLLMVRSHVQMDSHIGPLHSPIEG
jgi:hypothetical protein